MNVDRLGIPLLPQTRCEMFKVDLANDALSDGIHKPEIHCDTPNVQVVTKKTPELNLPCEVIGRFTNATVHLITTDKSSLFIFPLPIQ
jgi:hypothetical protein